MTQQAQKEEDDAKLIPTPLKFQFAFGNPEALKARRDERLAKWEWSDSFISRARPDKGNYGTQHQPCLRLTSRRCFEKRSW